MVPALSLGEQGKLVTTLILNAIMNAVGRTLGKKIQEEDGLYEQFTKDRIKANPSWILIMDELAAIVDSGSKIVLEKILSQARSANVPTIISTQEISALMKTSNDGMLNEGFTNIIEANVDTIIFLNTKDEKTRAKAESIFLLKTELDEKTGEFKEQDAGALKEYLRSASKGLGVIYNRYFGRMVVPYAKPKVERNSFKINK
jgi:DNA helicase HerA-like ATPase